jgi:hypothetical protein
MDEDNVNNYNTTIYHDSPRQKPENQFTDTETRQPDRKPDIVEHDSTMKIVRAATTRIIQIVS